MKEPPLSISPATEHFSKLEHPSKALLPTLVTELGIITEAKLEHPENALPPILVTASPSTTDFKVDWAPGNISLRINAKEEL